MESRLALALAEKLRRIYEKEDTFLTYPLGVAFPNRSLGFMLDLAVSGLDALEQLREKVEFARNLNIVPEDRAAFSADATEPLWARTLRVLKDAEFAQSGLTSAEEQRLSQAIDFLTDFVTLDNGIQVSVNSTILSHYYQYKVAYESAEATYLDEKITVESTTGPEGDALKAKWVAFREKQLRDRMQQALDDWNNLGQANQVRAAIATRNELELKKYVSLYRAAYEDEIKLAEIPDIDAGGLGVYSTFFSPYDVFTANAAWNKLTLTRTELDALADQATPELKQLFGSQLDVAIEQVTLEYSNVTVIRPWYRPEFFQSRTWRFKDATVVSDGATPRKGLIPGYITSILATRNITVYRGAGASQAPLTIPILTAVPLTNQVKGAHLESINAGMLTKMNIASLATVAKPTVTPTVKLRMAATRFNPPTATIVEAPRVLATVTTQPLINTRFTRVIKNLDNSQDLLTFQKRQFVGTTIETPPILPPPPPEEETPAPTTAPPEKFGFDGCIVLAYLCKRVPRSPNPDLDLMW